jgi:hypothetical protein
MADEEVVTPEVTPEVESEVTASEPVEVVSSEVTGTE